MVAEARSVTLLERAPALEALATTLGEAAAGEGHVALVYGEGVRHIPRGPRATTRGNPLGLTAREAGITALLARALTNARIGARLHISPKTVDHHVSTILGKHGGGVSGLACLSASRRGTET